MEQPHAVDGGRRDGVPRAASVEQPARDRYVAPRRGGGGALLGGGRARGGRGCGRGGVGGCERERARVHGPMTPRRPEGQLHEKKRTGHWKKRTEVTRPPPVDGGTSRGFTPDLAWGGVGLNPGRPDDRELVWGAGPWAGRTPRLEAEKPHPGLSGSAPPPPAGNPHPLLTPSTLHRAPVGQGPPGPDWLAISFGFWVLVWTGTALATGTAWAGLCFIHHHHHGLGGGVLCVVKKAGAWDCTHPRPPAFFTDRENGRFCERSLSCAALLR